MSSQTRQTRRLLPHRSALLAVALAAIFPATAHALIIANGAANTDGSSIYGFDAVGQAGQSSGVYLGNGWVLTARHSGATDFSLNGTLYPNVYPNPTTNPSAVFSVLNPAGVPSDAGDKADLIVYRIGNANQPAPVATPISISNASPVSGTAINIVGLGGWTPSPTLTYWSVNTSTTPWTWTQQPFASSANMAGYTIDPNTIVSGVRRWGTNVTDATYYDSLNNHYPQVIVPGNGTNTYTNTASDFTGFNASTGLPTGGTTYEASVYSGDSGGASFSSSNNKLVGITLYQDNAYSGQPGNTVAFAPSGVTIPSSYEHNNTSSYFADISVYAAEILNATAISEWSANSSANWTSSSWGNSSYSYGTVSAPNAAAATANFLSAITIAHTVTVSTTVTVGAINFNNANAYTLAGAGNLILDNSFASSAFPAEINTFSGMHTISVPVTLHSDLAVNTASGGGLILSANLGTDATSRALSKAGAGSLTLSGTNSYTGGTTISAGKLTIGNLHALGTGPLTLAGGLTQIQSGLSSSSAALLLPSLNFSGGTLDLTNNRLLIQSAVDVSTTFRDAVRSGFMTTSTTTTALTPGATTTIGYLKGADYTSLNNTSTFAGTAVGPNYLVARWTYAGDINLDGVVNLRDFRLMDAGYLSGFDAATNHIASWINGDVNHDGKVDFNDYALAVAAVNGTSLGDEMYALYADELGAPFTTAYAADVATATTPISTDPTASVPEPATLTFLSLAAGALLLSRRRARS